MNRHAAIGGRTRLPTLHLIGAPCDAGASVRGASMGPEALRVAGLAEALTARGHAVVDHGNLPGPVTPLTRRPDGAAPGSGHRHLEAVTQWNRLVFDAVGAVLAAPAAGQEGSEPAVWPLPLLLGGDHSLAVGSIAAVAAHCRRVGKTLRVLWLDAHADFNTPQLSPSGNLHGMPLACLCGLGPPDLVWLSGEAPALQAGAVRMLGIRSVDAGERRLVHQQGLPVYDMRHIDEAGMRATLAEALLGIDENTHLHVSLDVDFLDPSIAPGVGTAVPGGPSYREAQLCMEMIADTGALGSLDIVELNPACDERNKTALLVVDLIESLFGKSTLVRA